MGFTLNPFTGQLQLVNSGGGGSGVSSLNTLTGSISIVAGSGISVTPGGSSITIAATGSSLTFADSLVNNSGTVTLKNDSASPTAFQYYGTNGSSTLGYFNLPTITLGTPNGLSLAGTVLSLGLSSTSTTGALSSTDWNTFNSKQSALTFGSISTSTTGVTVGSGANSTVGPNVTVNIQTASGSQPGLLSSTDWNTFNNKNSYIVNTFTLSSGDISNGYVTLSQAPAVDANTILSVASAPTQAYGVDFIVSGTQLTWAAYALQGVLTSGDILNVQFY